MMADANHTNESGLRYHCACGNTLPPSHRKHCSSKCRERSKNPKALTWDQRFPPKPPAFCNTCWQEFKPVRGSIGKFCSYDCSGAALSKVKKEVASIKRLHHLQQIEPLKALAKIQRKLHRMDALVERKIEAQRKKDLLALKPCAVCAKAVGYNFGTPKRYCSQQCLDAKPKTEKQKELARSWRKKRKALQRGASTGVAVSPRAIFNRDGWRCQICLKPTPEKLRGAYKQSAPELDHIIPLSKGGAHSPDNIQTACRACNAEKSNKSVIGQMGLFTSLL
jgi:5-methylcytosine-specific restriction endonuclease McrA